MHHKVSERQWMPKWRHGLVFSFMKEETGIESCAVNVNYWVSSDIFNVLGTQFIEVLRFRQMSKLYTDVCVCHETPEKKHFWGSSKPLDIACKPGASRQLTCSLMAPRGCDCETEIKPKMKWLSMSNFIGEDRSFSLGDDRFLLWVFWCNPQPHFYLLSSLGVMLSQTGKVQGGWDSVQRNSDSCPWERVWICWW